MTHLKRLLNDLLDNLAERLELRFSWANLTNDEDDR